MPQPDPISGPWQLLLPVGTSNLAHVARVTRLSVVLVLNLVLVAGLVTVGLSARSLGVLAEGVDYLADAVAIGVSLVALRVSKRPTTQRRPQGYPRANAIAAFVNGGWLFVLSLLVVAGAVDRLATGTPSVQGLPVLVISGIAALVMLVGALILGGDPDGDDDDHADLSMRAVLLDTAADAAAAAGVAVTGGIILATGGFDWLDPTVALIIALVVGYHALRLLREVLARLMRPPSDRSSEAGRSAGSRNQLSASGCSGHRCRKSRQDPVIGT